MVIPNVFAFPSKTHHTNQASSNKINNKFLYSVIHKITKQKSQLSSTQPPGADWNTQNY